VVEQVVRPTASSIRRLSCGGIHSGRDLLAEINLRVKKRERVLVTT